MSCTVRLNYNFLYLYLVFFLKYMYKIKNLILEIFSSILNIIILKLRKIVNCIFN